jgi:hypothetical protein
MGRSAAARVILPAGEDAVHVLGGNYCDVLPVHAGAKDAHDLWVQHDNLCFRREGDGAHRGRRVAEQLAAPAGLDLRFIGVDGE